MYALSALTLLLAAATAAPTPQPESSLQQCGDQLYNPSLYVCSSGTLCPVVNGENDQECSGDCFTSYRYKSVSCLDFCVIRTDRRQLRT